MIYFLFFSHGLVPRALRFWRAPSEVTVGGEMREAKWGGGATFCERDREPTGL